MSCILIPFPLKEKQTQPSNRTTKVPAYARKLAGALMLRLHIQNGMDLVCHIGNGDEYSNQRAIETWLMTQYTEDDIDAMASPLDILEITLVQFMNIDNNE